MTTDHVITLEDGRTLGFAEFGDPRGVPLIALHGWPVSRLHFAPLSQDARDAGFRVVAPDRPGVGLSDPKPHRTYLDYVSDVRELADALDLGRPLLLGFSSGGPYAAACAARLNERVGAVALVSSTAPPGVPELMRGMPLRWQTRQWLTTTFPVGARPFLRLASTLARRTPAAFNRLVAARLSPSDQAYLQQLRRVHGEEYVAAPFADALRQGSRWVVQDEALEDHTWGFDLGNIDCPVQIWHGAEDPVVPVSHARYLARHIPDSVLQVIEGRGHLMLWQHVEEILSDLRAAAEGSTAESLD